jgi:1-acyl-sn-glycerol-3-phosphate acyltransferase
MIYRLTWLLCRIAFGILFRWRIVGAENVPTTGPVILASNHVSNLDPPVAGVGVWRHCAYMAKEELFRGLLGWYISRLHAFPVRRGSADRAALKRALETLEAGGALVMFPEGTRSETGELQPAELGVGMIAYRTGAPVVPVLLVGTNEVLPRRGRPRLARIHTVYGRPIKFEMASGSKAGRQEYEAAVAEIMAAIAELRREYQPSLTVGRR